MEREATNKKLNIRGRDVAIFVMSLLLAFAIWLIHNLSYNYQQQVYVAVTAQCNIEGHSGVSASIAEVHARCKASGFTLLGLKRKSDSGSSVTVKFEPSNIHLKSGDLFYITAEELNVYSHQIFGEGATVEAWLNDTVFFRFPFQNSRKVPVTPRCELTYKDQYTGVGEMNFFPDSVIVYGEPSVIDGIESIRTKPIIKSDVSGPLHGSVKLETPSMVRLSSDEVDYSLDVARFVEVVAEARVQSRGVPEGKRLVVYPSVVRVVLRCRFPMSIRSGVAPDLWIDYADFKKSYTGKCLPRIENLPDGVISVMVEPEVFECVEISL